jgi:hypothetical protein
MKIRRRSSYRSIGRWPPLPNNLHAWLKTRTSRKRDGSQHFGTGSSVWNDRGKMHARGDGVLPIAGFKLGRVKAKSASRRKQSPACYTFRCCGLQRRRSSSSCCCVFRRCGLCFARSSERIETTFCHDKLRH